MVPNGCDEYTYVGVVNGSIAKVKGFDNCFNCNVGINFKDKHYIILEKLYVEIHCSKCSGITRLPIFLESTLGVV